VTLRRIGRAKAKASIREALGLVNKTINSFGLIPQGF
jgi:hypothetical protein